jgi:hypothetical protein
MAAQLRQTVEFHRPANEAEAIYEYRDEKGKLLKQVLRHADKKFSQRRPSKGGWVWNTAGVRPTLYNLDRLEFSWTTCFCEGEKDCDTITGLGLMDLNGHQIIGVTSGGSDTWKDELADCLQGKRVIVLPDSDEPGMRFASEVAHSLESRAIEYRLVTFSDCGAKDIGEFLQRGGTAQEVVRRIGQDWITDHARATTELTEQVEP